MSKVWTVITEVDGEVDPATFNYVNGTRLISSVLKTEETIGIPLALDRKELWGAVMGSAFESFGDHWQEVEYLNGDWDDPTSKVRLVCHNDKYENVEKIITIDDIARALPIANEKVYMDLFDLDQYDAICGDAVLQVAVIGDVVFG
jgi:hypothetical protein